MATVSSLKPKSGPERVAVIDADGLILASSLSLANRWDALELRSKELSDLAIELLEDGNSAIRVEAKIADYERAELASQPELLGDVLDRIPAIVAEADRVGRIERRRTAKRALRLENEAAAGKVHDARVQAEIDRIQTRLEAARRVAEATTAGSIVEPPEWVDVAAVFAGSLEAPSPTLWARLDGQNLIYPKAVNAFIGDPETMKTWAAKCVVAETLANGGTAAWFDTDHNGGPAILSNLAALGVPREVLSDTERFRLSVPEDSTALEWFVAVVCEWMPTVVVMDSVGELVGFYGKSSSDDTAYPEINRATMAAMAKESAVIAIDHLSKSGDGRDYGPTGTLAKKRAYNGAIYRMDVVKALAPGRVGSVNLRILKDRHGKVRAASSQSSMPVAGTLVIDTTAAAMTWHVVAPAMAEEVPNDSDHFAAIEALVPAPTGYRSIKTQLGLRDADAQRIWKAYRDRKNLVLIVPPAHPSLLDDEAENVD